MDRRLDHKVALVTGQVRVLAAEASCDSLLKARG
jgi:hypothetical protein